MITPYPTKNLLTLLGKVIVTSHYHVGYDIYHRSNSSFFFYLSNDIIEEAYSPSPRPLKMILLYMKRVSEGINYD
jgi:hypothetical protein